MAADSSQYQCVYIFSLNDYYLLYYVGEEFQPGVPWKGIQSVDPESDPYMTPGSMLSSSAVSSLSDTEHQLLRDNTGSYTHTSTAQGSSSK